MQVSLCTECSPNCHNAGAVSIQDQEPGDDDYNDKPALTAAQQEAARIRRELKKRHRRKHRLGGEDSEDDEEEEEEEEHGGENGDDEAGASHHEGSESSEEANDAELWIGADEDSQLLDSIGIALDAQELSELKHTHEAAALVHDITALDIPLLAPVLPDNNTNPGNGTVDGTASPLDPQNDPYVMRGRAEKSATSNMPQSDDFDDRKVMEIGCSCSL